MRLAAGIFFVGVAGCSAVLGADFDRDRAPSASDERAEAPKTIPVDSAGVCPSARKRCGDACALTDDPAFGCSDASCAPCAPPRDGVAVCSALLRCDFTCAPGFERVGDRCVGFRVERSDMPELLAVSGKNEHEVYVAGGTPYEPARIFRTTGDSDWTALDSGATNNRLVFAFGRSPLGDLYLASQITSFSGLAEDKQPLFHLDASGSWRPFGAGDDGPALGLVAPISANELFATERTGVRHLRDGTWTSEVTDVPNGAHVWASEDGKMVLVVNGEGAVARRTSDGTWRRSFTPDHALGIQAVWGTTYDDVYLLGANGLLMHSRNAGQDFTTIPTNTTEMLFGMWGSGNEHWVVGAGGLILHAGADDRYEPVSSGTDALLRGIWGTSPTNIYVVGIARELYRGFILHRSP